jgi:hypothetical protein
MDHEQSLVPVQLKHLEIRIAFEYAADWRFIERFSSHLRQLGVVWRHEKTSEELEMLWKLVCVNRISSCSFAARKPMNVCCT